MIRFGPGRGQEVQDIRLDYDYYQIWIVESGGRRSPLALEGPWRRSHGQIVQERTEQQTVRGIMTDGVSLVDLTDDFMIHRFCCLIHITLGKLSGSSLSREEQ